MFTPMTGIQVDKFYPPTDWLDSNSQQIDIRKNAENNTIVLLVGHSADFTKYSLLGLLAQVSSGTYDVYIDDVLVGSAVTSNTQYDIDFSTIATSYGTATTPEALVLHKVVIKPNTSGSTITKFKCARTSGTSGYQSQGVLWGYFELENKINLYYGFCSYVQNYNENLIAITSKGNIINATTIFGLFSRVVDTYDSYCLNNLQYLPVFNVGNLESFAGSFTQQTTNNSKCLNIKINSSYTIAINIGNMFINGKFEKINNLKVKNNQANNAFKNVRQLKVLPNIEFGSCSNYTDFITNAINLYPTKLNINDKNATKLGMYGTSTYPMRGLRGLKVSNEAPFSGASPQIDVSYTGLDRDALRELFNSLPAFMSLSVEGSPTINNGVVSGFSSSNYLKRDSASGDLNSIEAVFNVLNIPETLTQTNCILSLIGGNAIRLYLTDSKNLRASYKDTTNTTKYMTTVGVFSSSYVKIKLDTTGAYLYSSDDGVNWTLKTSNTTNIPLLTNAYTNLKIGIEGGSYLAFEGSININNSYMVIDGTKYTFLLPSATTRTLKCVGATGNNLTKVGSPTIDENGVASGFSSSNRFTLPRVEANTYKRIEIKTKIITGETLQASNIVGDDSYYGMGILISSDGRLEMQVNFSNYDRVFSDVIVEPNTEYTIIGIADVPSRTLSITVNGVTNSHTLQYYTTIRQLDYRIGYGTRNGTFNGSIYLEDTSIKIDRNYLMKGYITDTDKNIALNKGWALTLS